MKNVSLLFTFLVLLSGILIMSCEDNTPFEPPGGGGGGGGIGGTTIPPMFDDFWDDVTISNENDDIIIETTSVPDYRSPYFSPSSGNQIPYNGSNPNFAANPYFIQDQNIKFRIPINQDIAANPEQVPHDSPIGVAVNGVVLYSGFSDANNEPLTTEEINSLDANYGHPDSEGVYHYHLPPDYVLNGISENSIVGIMLDGFPIYGPIENGQPVNSADLDEFHGHFHDTFHQPDSIYHYHMTYDAPYLIGPKYHGVPGTVEN